MVGHLHCGTDLPTNWISLSEQKSDQSLVFDDVYWNLFTLHPPSGGSQHCTDGVLLVVCFPSLTLQSLFVAGDVCWMHCEPLKIFVLIFGCEDKENTLSYFLRYAVCFFDNSMVYMKKKVCFLLN